MSFRFFRRIKIAPGVTINLSKGGVSTSIGPRGAKLTLGSSGIRQTIGIPGTGIYHTTKIGGGRRKQTSRQPITPANENRLNLSFFQKLRTPATEKNFVNGIREYSLGSKQTAYNLLSQPDNPADAAFMAGIIAVNEKRLDDAERHLRNALRKRNQLNSLFSKYGISPDIKLPVTDHISAPITPTVSGIQLILVEICQNQKRHSEALKILHQLHNTYPDDPVIILSLSEILVLDLADPSSLQQAVTLSADIENLSEIETAILHLKGKALRLLGLHTAARTTLNIAFRRKKDRSPELLRAIQYERALTYEALGQSRQARQDLEQIFAEDPKFADVAHRLGLKK